MLGLQVNLHRPGVVLQHFLWDHILKNVGCVGLEPHLLSVRGGQVYGWSKENPQLVGAGCVALDSKVEGLSDGEVTLLDDAGLRSFPFAVPI